MAAESDIYSPIVNRLSGKRVVGINGVDCSGKTIFAETLAGFLNDAGIKSSIIHIDDFHNPRAIRSDGASETDAYYNNAFNYRQLVSEILEPLKENGEIHKTVTCLNIQSDKYENHIDFSIDRDTIVLLEGVLLFRPPVLEFFDYKIFLQVSFDEALRRAEARDVPVYGKEFLQKYHDKFVPVQKRYLDEWHPQDICDILVDNEDYRQPVIVRR